MVTFKEKYYITTAIAYVNGKPHIGHTLEFIQSDFVARYQRALGKDVHFLTGTDEHGQKMVEAAKEQGLSTKKLVDKNAQRFMEFTKLLNMSNDDFIRTTDQQKHWPSVIKLWKKLVEKGDLYKKTYEGLYCVGCEKFITEKELDENGNCPNHHTPPKKIQEENYFFKLSAYAQKLHDLIDRDEIKVIPRTRKNEILSFLAGDVQDISFSRHKDSLTWGIPVPDDPDQVMYVWCDALSNYISAVDYANESEIYTKFWPADVHVIGKDILRFHAAYWPAMHLSAGVPVPKRVFAHGFVNSKGQKMSKSLGNVIDPYEQIEKFGLEQVRLYLLKELPSHSDGDYDEDQLIETINNDLANDLGNLIRRVTTLIEKHFDNTIPKQGDLEDIDKQLIHDSNFFKKFDAEMEDFAFNNALNILWDFVRATNKYLSDTEPWKIKDEPRLGTVLYNALESVRIIANYLLPAMPETATEIFRRIGQEPEPLPNVTFSNSTTGKTTKGYILFKKYEETQGSKKNEKSIKKDTKKNETIDDPNTFPLHLKVAEILEADNHPDADKLLVLQVSLGDEKRQIVAGIKGQYPLEELVGRKIIIVSNLKHAKLRGKVSQGMLLAGEDDENHIRTLTVTNAAPGTSIVVDNLKNSDKEITFDTFQKVKMLTNGGHVEFNGAQLKAGEELVSVDLGDGFRVR